MAKKTLEEQISEMEARKSALEARIKTTKAKAKEAERKARTHRLIETGAVIEKAFGRPLDEEDRRILLEILTEERQNHSGEMNTWAKYLNGKIRERKSTGSL